MTEQELAMKAFKRFGSFMLLKWAAIFAVSYAGKKYIQHLDSND